jgi:hypothetical protein
MAAIVTMILALVALLAVCSALAALGVYLTYAIPSYAARAASGFASRLDGIEEHFESKSRRAQIEEELQARRNNRRSRKGVDHVVVEAAEAMQSISIGLKMVKEATGTCCEIQLLTADMLGVAHMEDVEWDPVCVNLRQNVLETIDVALEHLDSYPIVNRKVIKQGVALRGFVRVCEDCELLKYSRNGAPLLCRPAKLTGNEPCQTDFEDHARS